MLDMTTSALPANAGAVSYQEGTMTERTIDRTESEGEKTIRQAALDLLCHVEYYEDKTKKPDPENNRVEQSDKNARSVGIAYDEIIRRIQEEFPGCETSAACLRWYAVKVRVEERGYEGLRLPQRRPRVKPNRGK